MFDAMTEHSIRYPDSILIAGYPLQTAATDKEHTYIFLGDIIVVSLTSVIYFESFSFFIDSTLN